MSKSTEIENELRKLDGLKRILLSNYEKNEEEHEDWCRFSKSGAENKIVSVLKKWFP